MTSSFRALVVVSAAAHGVGLFLLPNFPQLFAPETLELARYAGHGARVNIDHVALWGLYLLPYPALIGMYFFKNWGRMLFAGFLCVVGVSTFFFGVSISGPPETFVSFVAYLADGAILGLAFGSSLADSFGASRPAKAREAMKVDGHPPKIGERGH
jgi:hypothetical protein